MKLQVMIEQLDDNDQPIKNGRTGIKVVLDSEQVLYLARWNAIAEALPALLRHEAIKYANAERAAALGAIEPGNVPDKGEFNAGE